MCILGSADVNMCYRGRSVLPRNFDHIVLDKKAIEKLHSLGIDYQQGRLRGVNALVDGNEPIV